MRDVATVALSLIGYLALFHVFDALQGITGFVLRAHKIALAPTLIAPSCSGAWDSSAATSRLSTRCLVRRSVCEGLWTMQAVALFLTAAFLLVPLRLDRAPYRQ